MEQETQSQELNLFFKSSIRKLPSLAPTHWASLCWQFLSRPSDMWHSEPPTSQDLQEKQSKIERKNWLEVEFSCQGFSF